MLNVQEGVVTSCVILLHVFNAKVIGLHLIINEILLYHWLRNSIFNEFNYA